MSMKLDLSQGMTADQINTIGTIGAYLGGMLQVMGETSSGRKAARAADAYIKENPLKLPDQKMAIEVVDNMTADTQKEFMQSTAGLSDRAKRALMFGAMTVIAGAMLSKTLDPAAALTLSTSMGAVLAGSDYALNGNHKKVSKEEYRQMKHALVALNKMRKALDPKNEFKESLASNSSTMRFPAGMMVAMDMKNGGR
ncbi:MAG: hypothetical protein J5716_00965 [Alphaproteobacteria bacterium]|nr:hypothetical protein [Alphaproteobacteria bacterium]